MIRINQLKLKLGRDERELESLIAGKLRTRKKFTYEIVKKSLDARKKPELYFIYSVNVKIANEQAIVKKVNNKDVMLTNEVKYIFPQVDRTVVSNGKQPVIAGFGPAGMFCALYLARAGFKPLVIERGARVEDRVEDVKNFWEKGVLKSDSNVQFGEGGAGTFSDGKLNTMIKDSTGRIREVLKTFVEFGAKPEIMYHNKPHIGTDELVKIVRNIRNEIIRLGGCVRFNTCLEDIIVTDNTVTGIVVRDVINSEVDNISCDRLVMAVGHSARDTFAMLKKRGINMQPKPFAVGVRVEHPQTLIDNYAYGADSIEGLMAADYKVTAKVEGAMRGAYSFCMCPGGYVVNASSEEECLAVNGMSYSGRDGKNANSAIVVTVNPEDFGSDDCLAGVEFQRRLEKAAYREGDGRVPVQLYGDFKANRTSDRLGSIEPSIKGEYRLSNLNNVLPDYICKSIVEGMEHFDVQIPGFAADDVVLSGVESRTSSPVKILRNEQSMADIVGLYPCGEGAGYAGGITSAAVDGIKTAENIAKYFGV